MDSGPVPPLNRISDLVREFNVSKHMIRAAIKRGELRGYKPGRDLMVSRPEFEEWLRNSRIQVEKERVSG